MTMRQLCVLLIAIPMIAIPMIAIPTIAQAGEKPGTGRAIPKPIRTFLKAHPLQHGSFDGSAFPVVKHPEKFLEKARTEFLFHAVDPHPIGSDLLSHLVIFNPITNEYWVYQIGGLANLAHLYGPIRLTR